MRAVQSPILPKNMLSIFCFIASATTRLPGLESQIRQPVPKKLAPTADLRTDCARYAFS